MIKMGNIFFKYRSYTPLPFLLIMLLYINPNLFSILFGLSISICGEIIRIWAVSYAGSETRTTESAGGTNLVTQGPYSILRNPLYLGNILIYTGMGIMSNSLFPFLQICGIIYFSIQYYFIIIVEENYLTNQFGEIYNVYRINVSRFIPGFKMIPEKINSNLEFDLNSGLKSEKRSLQAFIITSSVILFFYFSNIRIFSSN
jgi:protein-S-isoprenylcysteine O-methyltransferase Ste14